MNTSIDQSAQELINRLGNGAVSYMQERIDRMQQDAAPKELDQAFRLLTEVERQLNGET